jgi:hypothetical protein
MLTVRLAPAFQPELQVNMALLADGTTRAELVVAGQNVFNHSNASPDTAVKWQRGLVQGLIATIPTLQEETKTVTLDGDTYEISYSRGQTDLHISFMDTGNDSALLTWAKAVLSSAVKIAPQSKQ